MITWQVHGRIQSGKAIEPFYLEAETKAFTAGSQPLAPREFVGVATDGDWAVRRPLVAKNGEAYEIARFSSVSDHLSYLTHSGINSIATTRLTEGDVRLLLKPDPLCGLESTAEKGKVLGIEVLKVVRKQSSEDADNERTFESWLAPSLGCYALKTTVWQNGTVEMTTQVKWIKRAAPPSAFFRIPSGYTEMGPRQVFVALQKKYGLPDANPDLIDKYETRYRERQKMGLQ